ncbi:MAG: O-antigen/teichoic acid export membrane protein [Flavobacteriales bacterium]|jgi:O-antigen/teichoic acid export membrane protein
MTTAKLKWFTRGFDSALSAGRSIIPPTINFVLAYLVIKKSGQPTWGQFVDVLIFMSLSGILVSFGIKEYVLRQASLEPNKLGALVQNGILVRIALLIPCSITAYCLFPTNQALWLIAWLISGLIYAGINPIVNFTRGYGKAIVSELVFGSFILIFLSVQTIDQNKLISSFAIAHILRSIILGFFFRQNLRPVKVNLHMNLLVAGFPFFVMALSGMLQSKTDLYLASAILDNSDLAVYQVSINFFLYLQALGGLILLPFSKNLYRVSKALIFKISIRFALFGIIFLCTTLPIIYGLLNNLYGFDIGWKIIGIGGLYVLPTFVFSPLIYKLLGKNMERVVLYVILFGVLVNGTFTYFLLLKLGFIGAFIGSMISNWAMLFVYLVVFGTKLKSNEKT